MQHKVLDCNKENCSGAREEERQCRPALASPRVSGSGQTDETDETPTRSFIKAESDEKKPIVKDSGANTVKSGKDLKLTTYNFVK